MMESFAIRLSNWILKTFSQPPDWRVIRERELATKENA